MNKTAQRWHRQQHSATTHDDEREVQYSSPSASVDHLSRASERYSILSTTPRDLEGSQYIVDDRATTIRTSVEPERRRNRRCRPDGRGDASRKRTVRQCRRSREPGPDADIKGATDGEGPGRMQSSLEPISGRRIREEVERAESQSYADFRRGCRRRRSRF